MRISDWSSDVCSSDLIDAALADRMIAAQATRRQRLAIADDVIVHDGALAALDDHVEALDRRYRTLSQVGATYPTAAGSALDLRIEHDRPRHTGFGYGRGVDRKRDGQGKRALDRVVDSGCR